MAFVPLTFRGLYIAPLNKLGVAICLLLGGISIIIGFLVSFTTDYSSASVYGIIASWTLFILAMIVATPGAIIWMGFLLTPAVLAIYGIFANNRVWREWWFWILVVGCFVAACFTFIWYLKRYFISQMNKATFDEAQKHMWRW